MPTLRSLATVLGLLVLGPLAAACTAPVEDAGTNDGAIASTDGTPLEFRFDAEVVADRGTPVKNAVIAQLEYLQGVLTTGSGANAQFRFVEVEDATEENVGTEKKRINYTGSVAVIFPAGKRIPQTYKLALPLDVTALGKFNEKYDGRCGKNAYGLETFWHDFNPTAPGCTLESDVMQTRATVRRHPLGTTDKYPEYDQVWADGRLDIVAVYGALSEPMDADMSALERESFLSKVRGELRRAERKELPAQGGLLRHSVLTGKMNVDGAERDVRVVAYFVAEARSAGTAFFESFAAETASADYVHYSGHAALGKNVAALAGSLRATRGKYQIAFFNGCQTFGYLGSSMHESRRRLNGEKVDPHGTKFLDVIVTALPARVERTPSEQLLFDALREQRKGWQELLRDFSDEQYWGTHLTAVFGEDDNTFRP